MGRRRTSRSSTARWEFSPRPPAWPWSPGLSCSAPSADAAPTRCRGVARVTHSITRRVNLSRSWARLILGARGEPGRIINRRRHVRRFVSLDEPGMHDTITDHLATALREALTGAGLPVPDDVVWEVPREEAHGDYATNVAMTLARPAKKAPRQIAEAIASHFPKSGLVDRLEIAGPGFLNVFLAPDWCARSVKGIFAAGGRVGQ